MDKEVCGRCEKVRELKHGSGLCPSCYILSHQKDVKCTLCGNIRKLKGKGMCAPCYLARPEYKAARNAKRREQYQNDPAFKEQTAALRTRSANLPNSLTRQREYQRQRTYGLKPEAFDALMAAQESKCAVCSVGLDEAHEKKGLRPHVDHCHKTGFVRGLLCSVCNTALGGLKDDPELLRRAIGYLEKTHAILLR